MKFFQGDRPNATLEGERSIQRNFGYSFFIIPHSPAVWQGFCALKIVYFIGKGDFLCEKKPTILPHGAIRPFVVRICRYAGAESFYAVPGRRFYL